MALNIRLEGRKCLVVGGGEVGERKARTILAHGAGVRLISRELRPGVEELIQAGQIEYGGREFNPAHLDGISLVFAASSDAELNCRVAGEARKLGLFVNVADRPELGDLTLPASFSRGDLTISVSTAGKSPALAARVKKTLAGQFGDEYGRFLEILGAVRAKVLAQGRPSGENRGLFRELVESDLLRLLADGADDAVEKRLMDMLGPEYSFPSLGLGRKKEGRTC
ncbi:MAG: bifunctional precorrin-2 dehydrogenase/sirohydrochlorin ferrochelatase [Pseudomonadota bacterium]